MNFLFESWAGNKRNPKIVLLLGGPGAGKTYIANQFKAHGFRTAILDQYFEALTRKKTGESKINVSLKNPAMKQDYVWSAIKNDNRMAYYMKQGYPFVTEKTGQNYNTIAQLKTLANANGYDVYAIYVKVDLETALQRNALRPRSLSDVDEFKKTHEKVIQNMHPSSFGAGISGLFDKNHFFEIDANNKQNIDELIKTISNSSLGFSKLQKESLTFRQFFFLSEAAEYQPQEQGNMLAYNIHAILEPGQSIILKIPEQYRHLVIRDIILAHRKGPHGHGEPHMKFEPEKNKWRDYYGAYTRVEAHDIETNTWHTYVDDYGASYKFAEHRPGDYEEETLHDWIRTAKIKPDMIKLSNPGNQRAKPHPVSGEAINPMDKRSSSEIASLKVVFFPNIDFSDKNIKVYERFYSKVGGSQDSPARFANFQSQDKKELEPVYGNYGAGIYPNALVLAADWSRQGRRIKQMDGGYYFIVDKKSFDKVSNEIGDRATRATGGGSNYYHNGKEYVKVFPVTLQGGPGTQVSNNILLIDLPPQIAGKKLLQVEVMCGDTEFRPDRIERDQPWKRLGFASLLIGMQSGQHPQWFTNGISVAPQMVAAAAPKNPIIIQSGDKIILKSERDTTYIMGWRISYS